MLVSEILDKAADLIEPEGAWTRNALARRPDGHLIGPLEEGATCWCLYGALDRVTGVSGYDGQAATALSNVIDDYVSEWNDRPARTQQEVVTALREAARKEREAGR